MAFPSVGLSVAIFCRIKLEVITGKSNFYKRFPLLSLTLVLSSELVVKKKLPFYKEEASR